ncbi:alkaline phosphatase family protein [Bacillus sp. B190/17]|uniref:Alkaline phosphatase family protein n=1 Tax=Bacillus lumedeiriae TaxID=3058829 RepID=A0ABW8I9B7_9BACI
MGLMNNTPKKNWLHFYKKSFPSTALIATVLLTFIPLSASAADKETMTILSFDGMSQQLTEKYIQNGRMPHLKKIKQNGTYATNFTTVFPSLTAVSHASMSTGAYPEKTGFVSNSFHHHHTKISDTENAFQAKVAVSPLWKEARKQGKVTATVGFPGSNPPNGVKANYAVYYGGVLAESSLHTLHFKTVQGWTDVPTSFSLPKEGHIQLKMLDGKDRYVHILAVDSTDNGQKDYDHFYLSEDRLIDQDDAFAKLNEWGELPLRIKGDNLAGFSFKLKGRSKDLSSVKLYQTAVTTGLITGPKGFKEELNKRMGFFPVKNDIASFKKGWIARKEYEEISERFVDWIADASLFIKSEYRPDLLLLYEPHIDSETHEFLLTDPRQPGYSQRAVHQSEKYIEWAYKKADQVIGKVTASLTSSDRLFIVSDHGVEPIHSRAAPNYELKKAGLLKLDKEGNVDPSQTKAYAVASGTIAHVYINVKNRQKGGIVDPADYTKVQNKIINTFKQVTDERELAPKPQLLKHYYRQWLSATKVTGFSWKRTFYTANQLILILQNKKQKPYGTIVKLDGRQIKNKALPMAGDVTLTAAPGYLLGKDEKIGIGPTKEFGSHGGDPEREELRPVFFAYGKNIERTTIKRRLSIVDIAPTIYKLLELDPPAFIDGKQIKEISN